MVTGYRDQDSYDRGFLDGVAEAADQLAAMENQRNYLVHRARAMEGPAWAGDCLACIEIDKDVDLVDGEEAE